jgi:hypothetical protein
MCPEHIAGALLAAAGAISTPGLRTVLTCLGVGNLLRVSAVTQTGGDEHGSRTHLVTT